MKKLIIFSVLCIFIIAPVLAKVVSSNSNKDLSPVQNPITATKQELLDAIIANNDSLPLSDKYDPPLEVTSFKQLHKWWYIAIVKLGGDDTIPDYEVPVLLSKFTNNKDDIRVVSTPGSDLQNHNISGGSGVPYDVIDKLAIALGSHDE